MLHRHFKLNMFQQSSSFFPPSLTPCFTPSPSAIAAPPYIHYGALTSIPQVIFLDKSSILLPSLHQSLFLPVFMFWKTFKTLCHLCLCLHVYLCCPNRSWAVLWVPCEPSCPHLLQLCPADSGCHLNHWLEDLMDTRLVREEMRASGQSSGAARMSEGMERWFCSSLEAALAPPPMCTHSQSISVKSGEEQEAVVWRQKPYQQVLGKAVMPSLSPLVWLHRSGLGPDMFPCKEVKEPHIPSWGCCCDWEHVFLVWLDVWALLCLSTCISGPGQPCC